MKKLKNYWRYVRTTTIDPALKAWRDAHPDEFAAEEEAKKDGVIADLAQVYLFTFTTLPWSQYV